MPIRWCALSIGLIFTGFGVAGLVPKWIFLPPVRFTYQTMDVIGHFGYLFAWLPTNYAHDALYLAIGLPGVLAAVTVFTSIWYLRGVMIVTLNLAMLGVLPLGIAHVFGLLPLFSWNVFLHMILAIVAYYYGFIYPLDNGGPPPFVAVVRHRKVEH